MAINSKEGRKTLAAIQRFQVLEQTGLPEVLEKRDFKNETLIFQHISNDNQIEIQKYLKDKKDLNISTTFGYPLLKFVITFGSLKTLKAIIASSKEGLKAFSKPEREGLLPLAAERGKEEIIAYLLELRVETKDRSKRDNETALMIAAKWGYHRIVKLLITAENKSHEKLFDVDAINNEQCTALMLACRFSNSTRKPKANKSSSASSPNKDYTKPRVTIGDVTPEMMQERLLMIQSRNNQSDVDKKIITEKKEALDKIDTPHANDKINYIEVVKILLEHHANRYLKDKHNQTAFTYAVRYGDITLLKLLFQGIKSDYNFNENDSFGYNVFSHAFFGSDADKVDFLLEQGKFILNDTLFKNNDNNSLLMTALIQMPTLKLVKYLAQQIDINAVNNKNETALMFAIRLNWLEAVQFLVESKADLEISDYIGRTALYSAATLGDKYINITSYLLKQKANPNHICKDGFPAIITAIREGYTSTVRLLLNASKEALLPNDAYETPLLYAIRFNHKEIFDELLLHYSKEMLNAPSSFCTPLIMAVAHGRVAMYSALLQKGADISFQPSNRTLVYAIDSQNIQIVQHILSLTLSAKEIDETHKLDTLFFALTSNDMKDNPEIFQLLLEEFSKLIKTCQIDNDEKLQIYNEIINSIIRSKYEKILKFLLEDKEFYQLIREEINPIMEDMGIHNCFQAMECLVGQLEKEGNFKTSGIDLETSLFNLLMYDQDNLAKRLIKLGVNKEASLSVLITTFNKENSKKLLSIFEKLELNLVDLEPNAYDVSAIMWAQKHKSALAPHLLSKKIWLTLRDNYIKQNLIHLKTIRLILEDFTAAFCDYATEFNSTHGALIWVPSERRAVEISFEEMILIFKNIVGRAIAKETLKYKDISYLIFDEIKKKKSLQLEKENKLLQEKTRLLYELDLTRIEKDFLIFPFELNYGKTIFEFMGETLGSRAIPEHEDIQNSVSITSGLSIDSPILVSRVLALLNNSNQFLSSKAAFVKLDNDDRLQKQTKNKLIEEEINKICQEMNLLKENLDKYISDFLEHFNALAIPILEVIENNKIEEAIKLKQSLELDPIIVSIKDERLKLLNQLHDRFITLSQMESTLKEQYEKEQNILASYEKQKSVEKINQVTLKTLSNELKILEERKASNEKKAALEREVLIARRREQYQKYLQAKRLRKEYWDNRLLEIRTRKQESLQNKKDCEHKNESEHHQLKKHQQRYFAFDNRKDLSKTLSAIDEIIDYIKKQQSNKYRSKDELFCERVACFGLIAHIAELLYHGGGIPGIAAKESAHLRNVLWHAKKSFLNQFIHADLVDMVLSFSRILNAFLKNDANILRKEAIQLRNSNTIAIILSHDLPKEPLMISEYEFERKSDKEEQLHSSSKLTHPLILEHANRFHVGRIGGFSREIEKYYPKAYQDNQSFAEDINKLNQQQRLDQYIWKGIEARHALRSPTSLTTTKWLQSHSGSVNEDFAVTELVGTDIVSKSSFLPGYTAYGENNSSSISSISARSEAADSKSTKRKGN